MRSRIGIPPSQIEIPKRVISVHLYLLFIVVAFTIDVLYLYSLVNGSLHVSATITDCEGQVAF